MATSLRLTGWWRLWIFLTAVWLVAVGASSYFAWPSGEQAEHHPAFIYQLNVEQRELLASEGASSVELTVEMPNGYMLNFKPGIDQATAKPVAQAYHDITVRAQVEAQREHLKAFAWVALIPPIALALLGVGVAWVKQGFKAGKS